MGPDGDRRAVAILAVVVYPAVIVRRSDHHSAVARIDRERGLVLATACARAFVERVVGVMRKPRDVVGAHVAAAGKVVRQANVDSWCGRQHGRRTQSEGGTKGRQDAERDGRARRLGIGSLQLCAFVWGDRMVTNGGGGSGVVGRSAPVPDVDPGAYVGPNVKPKASPEASSPRMIGSPRIRRRPSP